MTRRTRTMLLAAAAMAALAIGWIAAPIIAIGVSHKAKVLCSGAFVSGRDPAAVAADLQADDLWIFEYIGAEVDREGRSVTTSALGLQRRRAVYRDGLGCTLISEGRTPSPLPDAARSASARPATPLPVADSAAGGALAAVVRGAFTEPDATPPRRTQAVVVLQHGRIVSEQYVAGIGPDTPLAGWSMSKSVVNALTGILVGQGKLALAARAPIAQWQSPGDPRAAITLDHLLRMSSGLRVDEGMANPRSDVMRMLFESADASGFAAGKPLDSPPGSRWAYSNGTPNIISRLIRDTLGDDTRYLTLPRDALFAPLGMSGAVMETDAAGTFVGSSYAYATARDWARFGQLYLQDGVWNSTRILPDGWVAYTRTPAPADPAKRYGAHFWLSVPEEYCGSGTALPADAFHAAGHEGQFVTIVPSADAVIVRLGRTRYPKAWDQCAFASAALAALDRGVR